jgi:hypothetical protein
MFKNIKTAEQLAQEALVAKREAKRTSVRASFKEDSVKSVTVNNVEYNGGFDSAIKLDAAIRLAESVGLGTVVFYGVYNDGHELSLADAKEVTTQIAAKYQQSLAKKQNLMKQVEDASLEELDGINWESN